MRNVRWLIFLAVLLSLTLATSRIIYAEEGAAGSEQLKLGGYLKLDTRYRLGEHDESVDDMTTGTTFQLKLSSQVAQNVKAFASLNVQGLDAFAEAPGISFNAVGLFFD